MSGTCCFLPCKGTNFSANHNNESEGRKLYVVVSYPAKVQIFQLITTNTASASPSKGCFLPCKGTNFSANHNTCLTLSASLFVVSYPAKVQIFQLITTILRAVKAILSCFLPCKGTNFSANHNLLASIVITVALFFTLQRYKFFGTMDMFRRQWVRFVFSYCPDFANA